MRDLVFLGLQLFRVLLVVAGGYGVAWVCLVLG